MLPPVLVQCCLCLCHVMANFTLEFDLLNISLGMREDSAVVFVTEATKTGHTAVISFLGQIFQISTNIGQLEGLLPEMLLLHLFGFKILVTELASVDFPLGHCFCPQTSTSIFHLHQCLDW